MVPAVTGRLEIGRRTFGRWYLDLVRLDPLDQFAETRGRDLTNVSTFLRLLFNLV